MMLLLAVDENFNNNIVRGNLRRNPAVDVVRVQDAGLAGANDESILAWAAEQMRVLLTHDASTMVRFALDRVEAGLPMPGLIEVGMELPIKRAIEDVVLLVECSLPNEWDGQVLYLPLR